MIGLPQEKSPTHVTVRPVVQPFPREGPDPLVLELEAGWGVEPPSGVRVGVTEHHHLFRG